MCNHICLGVLVVQQLGVGLVIERSLVQLPAGALSSQLGQLSLPSLRARYIEYKPAWLGLGGVHSFLSWQEHPIALRWGSTRKSYIGVYLFI